MVVPEMCLFLAISYRWDMTNETEGLLGDSRTIATHFLLGNTVT
jgi:hypothetical protein